MSINKRLLPHVNFYYNHFLGGKSLIPTKLLIIIDLKTHSSATLAACMPRFAASEVILRFDHQMHCELKIFMSSFVPDKIQLTYRAKKINK